MSAEALPSMTLSDYGSAYAGLGWCLCSIPPKTKGPTDAGWNSPAMVLDSHARIVAAAQQRPNNGFGLVHAPSGTMAFDVDSMEHTATALEELGIDLAAVIAGAPQIIGRPGRGKAIYRLPEGKTLQTHKLVWPAKPGEKPITVFELRAGNVQDVLPPTIHPDTLQPYRWASGEPPGSRDDVPVIPAILLSLWENWSSVKQQLIDACPWAVKAPPPPSRRPVVSNREHANVIGQFNQAHDVRAMLVNYGYKPKGKRLLAPTSTSMLAGVTVFEDGRCFSHHASDPLGDGHAHDAFDIFCQFEHGGDVVRAVKAAADLMHIDSIPALPVVDVQLLIANAKRRRDTMRVDPNLGEIPGELTRIPGALGELVDHITETSIKPQRVLAVTAGLVFGAVMMGRKYASKTDLRTNLYLLGVAPSTAGKDHARRVIKSALVACRRKDLIGGEDIKSGSAVISAVVRSPAVMFQLDEFGLFLQSVTNPNSGSFQADILRQLMTLRTSANSVIAGPEYADQRVRPKIDIEYPCVVLHGTTTGETFWPALSSTHVLSGFLNRLLVTHSENPTPKRQKPTKRVADIPAGVIAWGKSISETDGRQVGNLQGITPDAPFIIGETLAGERILDEFAELADKRAAELIGTGLDSLWGRAAAMAIEVAMVAAGSTNPAAPIIGEVEARWAVSFVSYWTARLLADVRSRIVDPEFGARCASVLRIVRVGEARGVSAREVSQRWKGWLQLKPREQDEIVSALIRNGDMYEMKRTGARGPATRIWVCREFAPDAQVSDTDE